MTRYVLQHRDTGHRWPLPTTPPEDADGFHSMAAAIIWAIEHNLPIAYFPALVPETDRAQPARLSGEP